MILASESLTFKDLLSNLGTERVIWLTEDNHRVMAVLLHALHGSHAVTEDPIKFWACNPKVLVRVVALARNTSACLL